jgi:predicted transcriptional regulator
MNDTTPPLHPMEREQLRAESTLVVTVKSSSELHDDVTDGIKALEQGDTVDSTPILSFTSYDDLMETLTPCVLDLIEAIRRDEPSSINEAARVVDRDVKNVHEEVSRLAQLGIIFFEEDGQIDILHTTNVVGFLTLGAGRSDANEGNFPPTAGGLDS